MRKARTAIDKINLAVLENDERFSVAVHLLRAYRRNASLYHNNHAQSCGGLCAICREHERLQLLYPDYVKGD